MKKTLTLLLLTLSCYILNAQNIKLYDVTPGNNSKGPFSLYAGADKLYFYAYDTTGYQVRLCSIDKNDSIRYHTSSRLWGTTHAKRLTTVNNNVIFGFPDSTTDYEPYILYPTGHYSLIEDLRPKFGSNPREMTTFGEKVYFIAEDSNIKESLFEYDNKSGNIQQVLTTYPSNFEIKNLIAYQDRIYFIMYNKVAGKELYTYDPKLQIYWRLSNILPQNTPNSYDIEYIDVDDNGLYFTVEEIGATYYIPNTLHLYKYDGIHEPYELPNSLVDNISKNHSKQDYGISVFKDAIYFSPPRSSNIIDYLLRYDLLSASLDTIPNTRYCKRFAIHHDKLYMNAYDTGTIKPSLYYYNGTKGIQNLQLPVSDPRDLTVFNDNLYFVAQSDDSTVGTEIFRFNDSSLTIENVLSPLSDIQLYPNPTSGDINIQFDSKENRDLEIIVTDIQGRVMYTEKRKAQANTENTINIPCTNFASGTYICNVKDKSGRLLLTKNFLKQ